MGFYGTSAAGLLPEVLRAFSERHPAYAVTVHELLLGSIDDILDGNVHVAFTRLGQGQTDLEVEVLVQEPRLVAVASSHPLAPRESVTYADLGDESFIINPAVQSERPPARWIDEQRRHGLLGRVAAEASSVQEVLALVAAGLGVCLLPSTVARYYPHPDITYLPCNDAEPALISLARRPGSVSPLVNAWIETARRTVRAFEGGAAGASLSPGDTAISRAPNDEAR